MKRFLIALALVLVCLCLLKGSTRSQTLLLEPADQMEGVNQFLDEQIEQRLPGMLLGAELSAAIKSAS